MWQEYGKSDILKIVCCEFYESDILIICVLVKRIVKFHNHYVKRKIVLLVWFLKRKNKHFFQLFWGNLKNGKIIKKDILPESPGCSIELKAS